MTIIHLPVSICYGISATVIPAVSGAKKIEEKRGNVKKAMLFTLALSSLATVFVNVFPTQILTLLFRNLSPSELSICVNLLKISSVSIVLHALLQTVNGVLIGEGRVYPALLGLTLGAIVKIILSLILISKPEINIYGSAYSSIACYFTAFLVNFIIVKKKVYVNADKKSFSSRQVNFQ